MRQNPCRYCSSSTEYNGKHYMSLSNEKCVKCKHIVEHKNYLKQKRMFEEGEPITTLDELLKQTWVIWHHSTKHIEVIKNNTINTVLRWLEIGAIRKAVRRNIDET